MNSIWRLVTGVAAFSLAAVVPRAAAAQGDFAPLRDDGNGIASLRRVIPVRIENRLLSEALQTVASAVAVHFTFSGDMPGLSRHVSLHADTLSASRALLALVRGSGVELLVSSSGPSLVARAERRTEPDTAPTMLRGRIVDAGTGDPIPGVQIEMSGLSPGANARAISSAEGRFRLETRGVSPYTVRARRIGYGPITVPDLTASDEITIRLERVVVPLASIVVVPGFYGVMEQRLDAPQTLSREQINIAPQLGEDLFRAVNHLPGISASDFSAAFRVRGGANDELHTSLDGVQLFEPFHLKDFDGAMSIIDVGAIAGLDITTGGFGAKYGDRLTGLLTMRTLSPPPAAATRTELALTLSTMRGTSHGSFAGDRGSWLLSARRGFLEYALRAAGSDDDLRPQYSDVLAKATYRIGSNNTVSLHFLHAGDKLTYQDEPLDPRLVSGYGSSYAWGRWETHLSPQLTMENVLSGGRLSWNRQGTRVSSVDELPDLDVDDVRTFRFVGLRQDWSLARSPRLLLTLGGEARAMDATYAYARSERTFSVVNRQLRENRDSLDVNLSASGSMLGTYATVRVRPVEAVTAELGLRYDRHSYTGDQHLSPRISAAWAFRNRATLRASWGRYTQAEGIHQLQVQDGDREFGKAETAEHRVLGLERSFAQGITTRVELYERRLLNPRARFVSVDNSIDVFPEIGPDRVLHAPTSGVARGVELFASREFARRMSWGASYAYAVSNDRVDGHTVPRTLDQRHTVSVDLAYRPSDSWRLSAGWLFHSGWPTTAFAFTSDTAFNGNTGTVVVGQVYDERNGVRMAAYHRLDLRVTKTFAIGKTQLSVFADLFNVYNRKNPRGFDVVFRQNGSSVTILRELDQLLPRLPSFGLKWEF
jgi:hypothetical protein